MKVIIVLGESCVGVDSSHACIECHKALTSHVGSYLREELRVASKTEDDQGESFDKMDFCQECVLGKQTKVSFGVGLHRSRRVLKYMHKDVWVPVVTPSLGGAKYFISFIDEFS